MVETLQIDRETLRSWEFGSYNPFPKQYPLIVSFLGYYPFENETSTLGGRIKKQRLLLGLNQEEFAALVKVNRSAVMYWENGSRIPKDEYLFKLKILFQEI